MVESNVTPLHVPALEVDNGAVGLLEFLLDQARRGEVLAIAGIAFRVGGETARFMSPSIAEQPVRAIGWLRVLQMRIEKHVDLDDAERFEDEEQ